MDVKPFIEEFMGDQTVAIVGVMLLITFLILIIACANVANLLLARSMRRQRALSRASMQRYLLGCWPTRWGSARPSRRA